MMTQVILNAIVVLFILITPSPALACRCTEPGFKTNFARADAVVMVRVDQVVERADGSQRAEGTVIKCWKTCLPRTITIITGDDCRYGLDQNQTYLLYVNRGENGEFGTYRCRGNRRESEARQSLRWLARHGGMEQNPTPP